jgi:hypothetical protein
MRSLSPKYAESFDSASTSRNLFRFARIVVSCLFLAVMAAPALAQEATVVGTVTDSSGAALPSVTVTLTNIDTGFSRTIKTNGTGEYVLPGMLIGRYNATAAEKGFGTEEKTGLVLNVGDRLRVDFALRVGTAQENVNVEAGAIAVQTDSGEVSDVISGDQITKLEANGRSIYSMVNLTPGASSNQTDFQTPTPVGGDANVSFNGQRTGHNIYLMDGGEDLDRGGSGNFSVMPSLESLAEFRVLSSNYSAEYGLSSAATMTTVLKSGTNRFHAAAWWFGRNDALDARNYFNPAPAKVAELRFNTYGFNAGGPVDFWRKNGDHKTFFFYNMEWRSLIQGQTLNQNVPLPSEYGGNFGSTVILDPALSVVPASVQFRNCAGGAQPAGANPGGAFTNNTIPTCMLDPNAQALLNQAKIFPAPTSGNQFLGGNNSPTTVREEIARVDHHFNDKFSIFGHWVSEQIAQTFGTTMWSGDNVPTIGNTFGNPSYSAVIHATHSIRPNLLNEIAFNYNGNRINILPKAGFGSTLASPFNLSRIFTGPNADSRNPRIHLENTGTDYNPNWTPWVNKADDYQIRDDISWVRGAHQLKMGASWAIYKKIQDVFAVTEGQYQFDGFFTGNGDSKVGNDFADFLLGYAHDSGGAGYTEDAVHDHGYWNNVSWAAYIQDNWRVNNRLTLNLGLRWDGDPHTYEANHRSSNFYPNLYNPANAMTFDTSGNICLSAAQAGCAGITPGLGSSPNPILAGYSFYLNGIGIDGKGGIPKGLVNNHWANFGPRLGFAYDVTGQGKTVIRGGFGMMYERIQGNDMYNGGTNVPFSANATFNSTSLSDPHLNVATGGTNAVSVIIPSITGIAVNNYKNPTSMQYSAGVQQSLGARSVLSISYVGNQNRHLNDYRETNMPSLACITAPSTSCETSSTDPAPGYDQMTQFPGFHSIKQAANEANSHYNSLQVDLHANVRRDLELQFGYTLSRSIDPLGAGSAGGDLAAVSNPYVGWRYDVGPSPFDRTHIAFVDFVYQLPVFRNSSNHFAKGVLGGWELAGVVTLESGAPFDVTLGAQNYAANSTNRPDLVGPIHYLKQRTDSPFGLQWIDASSLAAPAAGTFGNLPHNHFRGPGRDNWNLALHKTFAFTERAGLELRVEGFNIWNHTQFKANPTQNGINNNFSGSNFGLITQAYDPRVLQLGARLFF